MTATACAALAAACAPEQNQAWVPVEKGDLVLGVEVTGDLRAVDSTPIKPPPVGDSWDFKIAEMAPEGAAVRPGDVVVAFDRSELMRQLQQTGNEAEAAAQTLARQKADAAMAMRDQSLAVTEAEAALRKASLKAETPVDLSAVIEVRVAELDRKLAEMDVAHARARRAQGERHDAAAIEQLADNLAYHRSRMRQMEDSIARMSVAAPRAGTVIYPISWRGEKKKVGDAAWRMETVVEVAGLDRMVGDGQIDEVDSSKVRTGQRTTLRLDAHSDTEIVGRIASIARTVQRQSRESPARIVKLEIALDQTGGLALRPGMRFRGRIETGRVKDAVKVPAEAVFVTGRGPVAYRRAGGGWEAVRLETGRRNLTSIEVLSGLAPGDEVSRIDLERGAR
ncbi:MAG TPA: HlyD family efflux transporter periplasmic adaptor subunit [Candidatus Acidoferrum sp.]|nr:HlyD family efflux transporter periplasmic adaptor subunit [Candidatus Acidoferrum sp.]